MPKIRSEASFTKAQLVMVLLGISLLVGCLASNEFCVPGEEHACQCPNGETNGKRQCNAEGTGFESQCACEEAPPDQPKDISHTEIISDAASSEEISETPDTAPSPPDSQDIEEKSVDWVDSSDTKQFIDVGEDSQQTDAGAKDVPCNENPWQCPEGQTCWLSGNTTEDGAWDGTFACLNSRPNGTSGCTCSLKLGIPSCADGLYCLVLLGADAPPGHCTQYCDNTNPEHPCPVGFYCGPVDVVDKTIHLCRSETGQVETKDCNAQP